MYSYVPGLATMAVPIAPGGIGPVVHDPSRATIVWAVAELFVHVMGLPVLAVARAGAIEYGSVHVTCRMALAMEKVRAVPRTMALVRSVAPLQPMAVAGATGAGRGGTGPPSLNAHTTRFIVSATYCWPPLS